MVDTPHSGAINPNKPFSLPADLVTVVFFNSNRKVTHIGEGEGDEGRGGEMREEEEETEGIG